LASRTRVRAVGAALALLFLSACASRETAVRHVSVDPRQVEDICAIYAQNPHWKAMVAEAADKWNVPEEVKMAIIWRESAFKAQARPYKYVGGVRAGLASSALGYSQAIDGTWEWYVQETGNRGADRTDFEDAVDFVGWYMSKSQSMNGLSKADAFNQYLAYHEGHTGFERGSWRQKAWLMRAAAQVQHQAEVYRRQMSRCRA
jgi:hypothetical protein